MKKRARPISLSTIVKGQLAALSKTRPESSSVELTRNAKGDTQIKVNVADPDVRSASALAEAVYDVLRKKYQGPMP